MGFTELRTGLEALGVNLFPCRFQLLYCAHSSAHHPLPPLTKLESSGSRDSDVDIFEQAVMLLTSERLYLESLRCNIHDVHDTIKNYSTYEEHGKWDPFPRNMRINRGRP